MSKLQRVEEDILDLIQRNEVRIKEYDVHFSAIDTHMSYVSDKFFGKNGLFTDMNSLKERVSAIEGQVTETMVSKDEVVEVQKSNISNQLKHGLKSKVGTSHVHDLQKSLHEMKFATSRMEEKHEE